MEKTDKKGKIKIIIIIAAIAVAVLGILVAIYFAMGSYFKNHFWYNTVINGVDCSGKTIAEVENMIAEETSQYQLVLKMRGDKSEVITSVDIGLKPMFDGSLKTALEDQNPYAWMGSLFRDTKLEIETMVTYDEMKFRETVEDLMCLHPANNKEPVNAYVSEYVEGKGYEIIPETEGALVDESILKEALQDCIINLQKELSLEEIGCYKEAEICSDDEILIALVRELNKYVNVTVTYEFGEEKEVLDADTIHKWLSVDNNNQIVLDEEMAAAYVKELAAEYDTCGKPRSFLTSYGQTVQLTNNKYGFSIDQEKETEQLLNDIKAGVAVSREPLYSQQAVVYGENDHGGTYVEINITAQHLFFYKDGNLVLETDIISGNLAKGWGTPSGAFSITYKVAGKTLRGEDYAQWVDYWMPFNGGIGLHDCTWKDEFGGNIYKENGSHGCINIPPAMAKTIFNNIKKGDAVFVYELPGTESEKEIAQEAAQEVKGLISAIGTVTKKSESAITKARKAYDELSELAKGYVDNYSTLTSAEAAYKALQEEDKNSGTGSGNLPITPEQITQQLPQNPIMEGADPFILLHNGVYYLYSTNSDNGYYVYTSKDLAKWTNRGLCLKKADVQGDYWFWAPEVMYHNGKFYMVYTSEQHLGIAVANSPLGPFKQTEKKFLSNKNQIDGHFFKDDDGTVYLYFVQFEGGNVIYGAKMNQDMLSYDETTLTKLITASEGWETRQGNIAEGPNMIKHKGTYYLTYSANDYQSQDYAVGYATSGTPLGNFKKYSGNPILSKEGSIVGTGHHCFTTSLDGSEMYIVYHRHNSTTSVHNRLICVDKAYFRSDPKGGLDILVVDGPN